MSEQLQSPSFNLVAADDPASSVITAISEECTEDKWKETREPAEGLCANTGIVTQISPCDRRQATTARHLKGFVVRGQLQDSMEDVRMHSFYPVIDRLLKEMKWCFSTGTNDALRGVPALSLLTNIFSRQTMHTAGGPSLWNQ